MTIELSIWSLTGLLWLLFLIGFVFGAFWAGRIRDDREDDMTPPRINVRTFGDDMTPPRDADVQAILRRHDELSSRRGRKVSP